MGFSANTHYPRGNWAADLSANRDVALAAHGASATWMKVKHIYICNIGVSDRVVSIRDTDDTDIFPDFHILPDGYFHWPIGGKFYGFKFHMDVPSADLLALVTYFTG